MSLLPLALLLVGSAMGEEVFHAKHVDYSRPSSLAGVLETDGLVAMTNVPGLAAARLEALTESAKCVLEGRGSAPLVLDLQDKSKRSSWAAFQGESMPETANCPRLAGAMEKLRQAVDLGAFEFLAMLDSEAVKGGKGGLMSKLDGSRDYESFTELVQAATSLDHLHVYQNQVFGSNQAALDMHTDQGLFIAIVPSLAVASNSGSVDKSDESFVVEVKGQILPVVLPNQGDVLLFMVGDGANYLSQPKAMRPVPHGLLLGNLNPKHARAWFGRMFFAPKDAVLAGTKADTFQSRIEQVVESRRLGQDFPVLGCGGGGDSNRRVLADGAGGCNSTQVYCWMSCKPKLDCGADDAQYCQDKNGNEWADCPTCHDPKAKVVCGTPPPTLAPGASSAPAVSAAPVVSSAPKTSVPTLKASAATATAQQSLAAFLASSAAVAAALWA
ncbi:hypothetical protein BASA81_001861 [Batrachochytrium salamandrivorans]|nr:hypothetical protein BASA81_008744 [Batrachochytrium salamandrivorans]KAH9260089.1 hypothetical protein BASA81_001861 [Batrachochytrium salamandrivorans]